MLIVDDKGVQFKDVIYEYPFRLGKLKEFRGFKDVTLQITKDGKSYYLLIYDPYKGLIAKAKMKRLDAAHVVRGLIHRVGFSDESAMTKDEFHKYFSDLRYEYIGE
jgi:hypothetical protein